MAGKGLKHKAASGMVWTAFQKYSTMGVQFISGIILARLLTPHDYGCVGMLTIFMVLAEGFIDGGFAAALIQKKKPTQVDYSTIFFWNLGMAVVMYAILYACAPAIARFYDIPLLTKVLRVQALILFIYAFNIIQKNQLRKKLNFKLLSIITVATSIISLTITIWMAYKGYGVWSLVAQHLLTAAIPAIVFWFYVKWRPIWTFSVQSFKELFGFGFYMFLTHLINNFSNQLQSLLIGKVYDTSTLGYYSKAWHTEKMASHNISSIMTQVTYPLYAQAQDNKAAMIGMIKRLTTSIAYITFPMMFILILCAKPLFLLLYSEKWLPCVPYFQILCISGLPNCLQSINLQTISAIGKSKVMFTWTVIKRAVGIGSVVGGLAIWGMKGLLGGMIINSWFSYLVNISLVSKYIGYKWNRQLLDLMPMALASVVVAGICFGTGHMLDLPIYWDGALKCVLYALLYLGWSFLFKPEAYIYAVNSLPSRFRLPGRKKNNQKIEKYEDRFDKGDEGSGR